MMEVKAAFELEVFMFACSVRTGIKYMIRDEGPAKHILYVNILLIFFLYILYTY